MDQCPNNFCGKNKSQIDGDCHELDYQAGNKIIMNDQHPRCWCICSCLAENTEISTAAGGVKVQDIKENQTTVLAAGLDLTWMPKVVTQFSVATPGKWIDVIYLHYQLGGTRHEVVVTRDQLFLLKTGKIKPADKLGLRDELVDRDNQPVPILDLAWGSYNGSFYELSTTMEKPPRDLAGHLILSNGVVTPDFAVQVYQNDLSTSFAPLLADAVHEPSVGSPEWMEAHGGDYENVLAARRQRVVDPRFKEASAHAVQVPAYAADFVSPKQAKYLQKHAPKVPFGDPLPRQRVEELLPRFRCMYPDITFSFDWYDHTVNASSWVEQGSQQKNVYFSGGMARIEGFELEGLTLVFGHEIGHLIGHDIGPEGVTCEGEADYYGWKVVLRKYYGQEPYFDAMQKATAQFETLLGYLRGDAASVDVTRSGQPYPSKACRLDTLNAAIMLHEKPACAACTMT